MYKDRKKCFSLIKMTVAYQIKILDRKIKQRQAQNDLDRKTAKISAYSLKSLDKYEYLTFEGLDLLSKFLNKGLKKEDKRRTFEDIRKY